jgi:hypothetical protein
VTPSVVSLVQGRDQVEGSSEASGVCLAPRARADVVPALARAFREGGADGVRRYLDANPSSVASIGRMSVSVLESSLASELRKDAGFDLFGMGSSHEAARVTGLVTEQVERAVRERVRSTVIARLDQMTRQLEYTDIAQMTDHLRSARPGSSEHALARTLRLDGGEGDSAKVAEHLATARQTIESYRAHLFGGTWEPSDFPRSTATTLCAMGLNNVQRPAIAAEATEGRRATNANVHHAMEGVELAHILVECVEAYFHFGLATAGPLSVAVAGLAFGVMVGMAVEENQESRRAFAREIGL